MIDISIGLEGAEEFKRKLGITISEMQNLQPIFDGPIKEYLAEQMRKQFASEGSYGGAPWKATSPAYTRMKLRKYGHKRILELSGAMKRSILMGTNYKTTKSSLNYGTSVPYDKYVNGKRRIFAMTGGQKKALVTIIQREILKEFR